MLENNTVKIAIVAMTAVVLFFILLSQTKLFKEELKDL